MKWLGMELMTPYDLFPCLSLLIDHASVEVRLVLRNGKSGDRTPPQFVVDRKYPAGMRKIDTIDPSYADLLDTCKLITSHEILYGRPYNHRRTPLESTDHDKLARRLTLEKLYESAVIVVSKPWLPQQRIRQELLFDMQAWLFQQPSPTLER